MKIRLSRAHKLTAASILCFVLGWGIAELLPTEDPIFQEMAQFRPQTNPASKQLKKQMENIRKGKSIHVADEHGNTPIMNAALAGSEADIDHLLIKGARLHRRNPDGKNAIDLAATPEIRALLEACLLAEQETDEHEKEEMRRTLRKRGLNTDNLNEALFQAARFWSHNLQNTALLLALGADPNARNTHGAHILDTFHRHPGSLILLLRHGADPNANTFPQGGSCILARAVNDIRRTRFLLAAGASPKGAEILSLAAGSGNVATTRALLAAGADPNGTTPEGNSVLDCAVRGLHIRNTEEAKAGIPICVRLLLEAGARTEHKDKDGVRRSPISPGGMSILPECLRLLVDAGANVNTPNNRGANYAQIAVYKEATRENLELLEDIIDAGADLTHVDDKGETFLFYAIPSLCRLNVISPDKETREEAEELLEELLDIVSDAEPNPAAVDRYGNTALHLAAIRQGPADDCVIQYLLEMGVDPAVRNQFGRTALEALLRNPEGPRCAESAALLQAKGPQPKSDADRLLLACLLDDIPTLKTLLERSQGRTPDSACIAHARSQEAVQLLLRAGTRVPYLGRIAALDKPEMVAIFKEHGKHQAFAQAWGEVKSAAFAKALIEAGLTAPPLEQAATPEVLEYLLTLPGADANGAPLHIRSYGTPTLPMEYAVREGKVEHARVLLKHGAATNGYTTSLLAQTDNPEMVRLLMAQKATIKWRGSNGLTLLSTVKEKMKHAAEQYLATPAPKYLESFRDLSEIFHLLREAGAKESHPRMEEIKQALRRHDCNEKYESIEVVCPGWSGSMRLHRQAMVAARSSGNTDTGHILRINKNSFHMKWDRWGYSAFELRSDGKYHEVKESSSFRRLRKNHLGVPHYTINFLNEKNEEEKLYLHPNMQFAYRPSNKNGADVLHIHRNYRTPSIKLRWDDGTEAQMNWNGNTLSALNPESAKQQLREPRPSIPHITIRVVDDGWEDDMRVSMEHKVAVRTGAGKDGAEIREFANDVFRIKWERWKEVTFIWYPDGKYYNEKVHVPEKVRIKKRLLQGDRSLKFREVQLVHPSWRDTMRISIPHRVGARAGGFGRDTADIVHFNKDAITIKWDKHGEEVFERKADGAYHLKR